jgi:hypothetical protein
MRKKDFIIGLSVFIAAVLFCSGNIQVADASPRDPTTTEGRFRVSGSGVMGIGSDHNLLGYDTNGDPVYVSAGGGGGYRLELGYGLTKRFDVDLSFQHMSSKNRTNLTNAEASVTRNSIGGTFKVKFPFSGGLDLFDGQIKLGAGADYYFSADMGIGYRDLLTLVHSTYDIDYKGALGFHLMSEFETFMPNDWALSLGLRYSHVDFSADTESYSGPDGAWMDLVTDFENVNGSSIDILLTIGKYF